MATSRKHLRPPDSWQQDLEQLRQTKLFLVSKKGPLLYIIKCDNDNSDATYKVCIGSPQRCSCGGGDAKGKLCVHIMFVMIKCLRVEDSNPLAWQLSLREDEVDAILAGRFSNDKRKPTSRRSYLKKGDGVKARTIKCDKSSDVEDDVNLDSQIFAKQRELNDEICTICQEDMTEFEFAQNQLCFCGVCGSNFHGACFRILSAHSRSQRKPITCPLCRAPWQHNNTILLLASNNDSKPRKLPRIRCGSCKMGIHGKNDFVRCITCPSVNFCKPCFARGCHDSSHLCVVASASQYPPQWQPIIPSIQSQRRNIERDATMILQYRDFSPADYNALLSLDSESIAPPLYDHLANALGEVSTCTRPGEKCAHCSILLTIDRTARVFPCECIVHWSCAVSIILQGLSSSEHEGASAGSITCPICPKEESIFPSLRREPTSAVATNTNRATAANKVVSKTDVMHNYTGNKAINEDLGLQFQSISLSFDGASRIQPSRIHGKNRRISSVHLTRIQPDSNDNHLIAVSRGEHGSTQLPSLCLIGSGQQHQRSHQPEHGLERHQNERQQAFRSHQQLRVRERKSLSKTSQHRNTDERDKNCLPQLRGILHIKGKDTS